MADRKTRKMIDELINLLKTNGIRAEKAMFYGPYAPGLSHADSGVDVAIILSDFGKGNSADTALTGQMLDPYKEA
ncbi:MAG: hypothetical protein GX846_10875 [Deltaproteobacteria bacterium]|jgi:hypothetical protein|nr:hypothetical protein [Deltaproteobacteria bacterium]